MQRLDLQAHKHPVAGRQLATLSSASTPLPVRVDVCQHSRQWKLNHRWSARAAAMPTNIRMERLPLASSGQTVCPGFTSANREQSAQTASAMRVSTVSLAQAPMRLAVQRGPRVYQASPWRCRVQPRHNEAATPAKTAPSATATTRMAVQHGQCVFQACTCLHSRRPWPTEDAQRASTGSIPNLKICPSARLGHPAYQANMCPLAAVDLQIACAKRATLAHTPQPRTPSPAAFGRRVCLARMCLPPAQPLRTVSAASAAMVSIPILITLLHARHGHPARPGHMWLCPAV